MENVADALKIAASVLIFVLALTISINAFSEARMVSNTILEYNDREYSYTYVEDNGGTTERLVGLESIVPSIYKAYKENYKIVFDDDGNTEVIDATRILGDDMNNGGIYRRKDETGSYVCVYSIDLQYEVLGSDTLKEQFIMAILYGRRYSEFDTVSTNFSDNLGIYLNETGIYDKIISIDSSLRSGLKESLGIYYQNEAPSQGYTGGTSDDDDDTSSIPDNNNVTKRVITYSIPN